MRASSPFWLILMLAACGGAPNDIAPPAGPLNTSPPPAFSAPMDPGTISCSDLSTPGGGRAAVAWLLGQTRAGFVSGQRSVTPTAADVSARLDRYCAANPTAPIRGALA